MRKNLRIFFSNIGYGIGINGCLQHHLFYAYRHLYCPIDTRKRILSEAKFLIKEEDPDLCCFVEVNQNFNHLSFLADEDFKFFDIENKYGPNSLLRKMPPTKGKSNGFMSKVRVDYEKIFFDEGVKRLIYKIELQENLTLFFAHFSLKEKVRRMQIQQVKRIFAETKGEIIFMGDFNILSGLVELKPLLSQNLVLLNDPTKPTFTLFRSYFLLDLCLCTKNIAPFITLKIHPQPYSDHAALVVDIDLEKLTELNNSSSSVMQQTAA